MSGRWLDEGENLVANVFFGNQDLYLGLYTDPTTEPVESGQITDLTEPSGNGYARIKLDKTQWSIVGSLASYAQQTFTANGGAWGNVYGYFITDTSVGESGALLIAVEQFSGAPLNVGNGDSVKVSCKVYVS